MPQKIDNVKDLKTNVQTDATKVEGVAKILLPENRQAIVTKIDDFLAQSGMEFYEGILGFTDLFNTIFINTLSEHIKSDEEKEESNKRINDLRHTFSEVLNTRKTNFVAEDMVTLMSLLAEAVIISITEDTNAKKALEEMAAQPTSEQ